MRIKKDDSFGEKKINLGNLGDFRQIFRDDIPGATLEKIYLVDKNEKKISMTFFRGELEYFFVTDSKGEKFRVEID